MREPENSMGAGAGMLLLGEAGSCHLHMNSRQSKAFCWRNLGERKQNQCRLCVLILMKENLPCVRRYENKIRPRLDIMLVSGLPQVQSVTPDPLCPVQWLPATCGYSALNI